MAGAYTGGAYPLGITRDDVSLDDHFGWAPKDQVADARCCSPSAFAVPSLLPPGAYTTVLATAPADSAARITAPVAIL